MPAISVQQAFTLIRGDPQLGLGSMSHVDEAMTDKELKAELSDFAEDWGTNFTWKHIRKFYYDCEKDLWAQQGIKWPPTPPDAYVV